MNKWRTKFETTGHDGGDFQPLSTLNSTLYILTQLQHFGLLVYKKLKFALRAVNCRLNVGFICVRQNDETTAWLCGVFQTVSVYRVTATWDGLKLHCCRLPVITNNGSRINNTHRPIRQTAYQIRNNELSWGILSCHIKSSGFITLVTENVLKRPENKRQANQTVLQAVNSRRPQQGSGDPQQ